MLVTIALRNIASTIQLRSEEGFQFGRQLHAPSALKDAVGAGLARRVGMAKGAEVGEACACQSRRKFFTT